MTEFFLTIVNMSISASWIVLAVLLLRLVLKKAPKWITVLLWGIVAVRLICPFSIESALSLIPSAETISPQILVEEPEINTGISFLNSTINPIIQESTVTLEPEKNVNTMKLLVQVSSIVWVVGLSGMLAYTAISYWRVKRKIGTAVLLQDNIFQSENVVSPFVLGIFKPKIYLPFQINGQDMTHVIAHENAHIRRKDHWWKPLGFLLLSIHWFNPLMWLGYILLCRDIELACDEKVIKEMDTEQKADYSQALLTCSVNRRMIAACPLAFGEVSVKNRIKSVLNYKKPAFWIIIFAVVLCITAAIGFLTNPISESIFNSKFETGKCLYSYVVSEKQETEENNLAFMITDDGLVYKSFDNNHMEQLGTLTQTDITADELEKMLKQQGRSVNLGNIQHAYEISGATTSDVFLQKRNGTVYWFSFFSDGNIMSAFKLKRTSDYVIISRPLPTQLHTFIEEQILEHHKGGYKSGEFCCTDFEVLGTKKEGNCTTVYLWVLYQEYTDDNGLIENTGGAHIPTVITVQSGQPYALVEYWEPRDGTYYPEDIRDKFPLYLWPKAMDSQRYIKQQQAACDAKAAAYFASVSQVGKVDEPENVVTYTDLETTFSYAGYTKDHAIYYSDRNLTYVPWSDILDSPIYRLDTPEDLQWFKDNMGIHYNMDQGYKEVPSFNSVSAKYDGDFFKSNSLILVYLGQNNITRRFAVQNVEYGNVSFGINLKETTGEKELDYMLTGWFITVAVPDEIVEDCTNFYVRVPGDPSGVVYYFPDEAGEFTIRKHYAKTPAEEISKLIEKEEFVYTHLHYLDTFDEKWICEGYEYAYRLEVTGRLNNAATNTTYIVLCNESITFDQAWKASGFSSNSEDYFDPADAVIVGYRTFS